MPWIAVDIGETAGTAVIDVPEHLSAIDMERGFLIEFGARDGRIIVVGLYRWKDGFAPRGKHPQVLIASEDRWPVDTPDPMMQETR